MATGLRLDDVDCEIRPKHRGGARLQDAPKTLPDPPMGLWWGFDGEPVVGQVYSSKWLQPDAVDGLIDGG
jgi:hypothetical protein